MIPPCTRPWDILGQVQKSYAQTLKARDSGHFVLRETWRDSVNLIGELASVIVDGEIFQIFAARIWMDLAWLLYTQFQAAACENSSSTS
jgi:hypothetical protein